MDRISFPLESQLLDRLADAWQTGRPIPYKEACLLSPLTDEQAYDMQRKLGNRLGWWPNGRPTAWKLATGSPPKVAPVPDARLFTQDVSAVDDYRPATLCGIEVELVCELKQPITANMSCDELAGAIAATYAAIEIFDVRGVDWQYLPERFLLADLQMHGALILGESVSGWQPDNRLVISAGDVDLSQRQFVPQIPDLLASLPWLAEHAMQQGWPLAAGDLIATGSWCGLLELPAGTPVKASFTNVGSVSFVTSTVDK
jgi:2-keto-4-pentenoate hydratase